MTAKQGQQDPNESNEANEANEQDVSNLTEEQRAALPDDVTSEEEENK